MKHLEGSGMPVPYIGRKVLKGQGIYVLYVCYDFMMQYTKKKNTKISLNLPPDKPIY